MELVDRATSRKTIAVNSKRPQPVSKKAICPADVGDALAHAAAISMGPAAKGIMIAAAIHQEASLGSPIQRVAATMTRQQPSANHFATSSRLEDRAVTLQLEI